MSRPTRLDRFAAAVVLAALGVAWPVLDILGNNAEFFLARGSHRWEVAVMAPLLGLAVPLLAGLPALLPGRAGRWVSTAWIAALGSVLAFLVLRRLPGPAWLPQAVSVLVGGAMSWALHSLEGARLFFRYLSPAPLVVGAVFLFASPAGAVATDEGERLGDPVVPSEPVPVVMVVLDEFPLASLIHPDGTLREETYPTFTRLARDGTWFRNAVTVQQQTEHSVPAMVTGVDPDPALAPFAGQYPDTLFTALSGSHEMVVDEAITRLCPYTVCQPARTGRLGERAASLGRDVAVVAGHVLLPGWLSDTLPRIDRSWGDFGAATEEFDAIEAFNRARRSDPRRALEGLAEAILAHDGPRPGFFFTHVLLPHNPWQLLPDGRRYRLDQERLPGSVDTGFGDDEWLAAQALQRHLLQVGYVDRALGEVVAAMEEAGIYDESLLVVVADHGITIDTGVEHWRRIEPATVGDIAAVPLFVKPPGGGDGGVDDRRATTLDIAPTVADVLGFELPWEAEGSSLLGPDPGRTESTTRGFEGPVTYGVDGREKLEVAARYARWVPVHDLFSLVPPGSPHVLGTPAVPEGEAPFAGRIDRSYWYADVRPGGDGIPARVTGRLVDAPSEQVLVAVAVNDTIGAVTRTYEEGGLVRFQAMVPPDLFVAGRNRVDLLWLDRGRLLSIPTPG